MGVAVSASHHLSNAWLLSRCYTLKLLAETYVQRRYETSFSRRCNDCNDNKIVSRKKKKFQQALHRVTWSVS